jgi:putative tricarboxylic transport membrane protein
MPDSVIPSSPQAMSDTSATDQARTAITIQGPREFFGGLALVALSLFAFWEARDLPGFTGGSFGPATAPRLYAGLLLGLGTLLCVIGVVVRSPARENLGWRGLLGIIAAIVAFAVLMRPAGLAVSVFSSFLIGSLASRETRWFEAVIAAAILAGFCVILFVTLLNLPFSIWPPALLS